MAYWTPFVANICKIRLLVSGTVSFPGRFNRSYVDSIARFTARTHREVGELRLQRPWAEFGITLENLFLGAVVRHLSKQEFH